MGSRGKTAAQRTAQGHDDAQLSRCSSAAWRQRWFWFPTWESRLLELLCGSLSDFVQERERICRRRGCSCQALSSQLRQIQKLDRAATQPCENLWERKRNKTSEDLLRKWNCSWLKCGLPLVSIVSVGRSDTLSFSAAAAVKQGESEEKWSYSEVGLPGVDKGGGQLPTACSCLNCHPGDLDQGWKSFQTNSSLLTTPVTRSLCCTATKITSKPSCCSCELWILTAGCTHTSATTPDRKSFQKKWHVIRKIWRLRHNLEEKDCQGWEAKMELLALALLAFIAVQADEEVLVQEVKPTGDETVGGHDKKVVCYWGTWANYRPKEGKFTPESVDGSLCTHLIYSFAKWVVAVL